jgi:hypothetical protein
MSAVDKHTHLAGDRQRLGIPHSQCDWEIPCSYGMTSFGDGALGQDTQSCGDRRLDDLGARV